MENILPREKHMNSFSKRKYQCSVNILHTLFQCEAYALTGKDRGKDKN
jgi:hypothetical protein